MANGVFRVKYKPVSFVGLHNKIRSLCWLALSREDIEGSGLTVPLLTKLSGSASEASIRVLVCHWEKWGYIYRTHAVNSLLPTVFHATAKLFEWLGRHISQMPVLTWLEGMTEEQTSYYFGVPAFQRAVAVAGRKWAFQQALKEMREHPPAAEPAPPVETPTPVPETEPPPRRRGVDWGAMGRIVRGESE